MSRTLQARRTIELVALVTAALMVLTVALAASDAEAKKKKKRPQFNVVQCEAPTENYEPICEGTEGNDFMVGTTSEFADRLDGGEGTDVYDGRGGGDAPENGIVFGDFYEDLSQTSTDVYLIGKNLTEDGDINNVFDGGGKDTVLLSPFSTDDIKEVVLDGLVASVEITLDLGDGDEAFAYIFEEDFDGEEIESYVFADGTLTSEQIKDLAP